MNDLLFKGMEKFAVIAFGLMVIFFIHGVIFQGLGVDPVLSSDSGVYQNLATNKSVLDSAFWSGGRPAGLSLLMKSLAKEPRNLIAFQALFHLVSWLGFSLWIFYRSFNKYLGLLCAGAIMFMANSAEITLWNFHVLSESVSLSLVPIIGVTSYEIIIRKKSNLIWILMAVLLAFSMIRDANAYFVLAMAIPVIGFFLAKGISRNQLAAALVFIGLAFGLTTWSVANSRDSWGQERWFFSFMNNTGRRILVDEAVLEQFVSMGMPVNDSLMAKKGHWGSSDGWSFYQDPELSEFRSWVSQNGKSAYSKFLILNPAYSFSEFKGNKKLIFHADKYYLEVYEPDGFEYPNLNMAVLVPNHWIYLFFIISTAIFCCIPILFGGREPKERIRSAGYWALLALSIGTPIGALFFISFHGDAMEVSRHTLPAVVLLKVWLVLVFFAVGNSTFKNHMVPQSFPGRIFKKIFG